MIFGLKAAADSDGFNMCRHRSFWFTLSAGNHVCFSVSLQCVLALLWTTLLGFRGLALTLPPLSCPVAVRLSRTVACTVSQGAEADVEHFTHLKALEEQP